MALLQGAGQKVGEFALLPLGLRARLLGPFLRRAHHPDLIGAPPDAGGREKAEQRRAGPAAVDPRQGERPGEAGFWRRVDEAAFFERPHAFREHPVRHLDALPAIDLAQALDQVGFAARLVQLAGHQIVLVAQGVDDVHRQHQVVELLRRGRGEPEPPQERAAPGRRGGGGVSH